MQPVKNLRGMSGHCISVLYSSQMKRRIWYGRLPFMKCNFQSGKRRRKAAPKKRSQSGKTILSSGRMPCSWRRSITSCVVWMASETVSMYSHVFSPYVPASMLDRHYVKYLLWPSAYDSHWLRMATMSIFFILNLRCNLLTALYTEARKK